MQVSQASAAIGAITSLTAVREGRRERERAPPPRAEREDEDQRRDRRALPEDAVLRGELLRRPSAAPIVPPTQPGEPTGPSRHVASPIRPGPVARALAAYQAQEALIDPSATQRGTLVDLFL